MTGLPRGDDPRVQGDPSPRLADQIGLDVFGLGEHHRRDFAVSSPAVVLAAGGGRG